MSGDAKKDDHGHGAENKTFAQKLVGVGVSVLLVLLFVYVLGALIPSIVTGAADLIGYTGNSLGALKDTLRGSLANLRAVIKELILGLIIPALFLFFAGKLIKDWFSSKKDDGHGHH